jgi:ComF family protein
MFNRFRFLNPLLHLFFPHTCCGCGTELLEENVLFCIYCEASMPFTRFEFFPCNPIEKIFWGRVDIQAAAAHMYFTRGSSIQKSLHLLKYKGRKQVGYYFGARMGMAIKNCDRFAGCELIIPLPLYAAREKKRGYNQANVIAEGISTQLNIPVISDVIFRTRKTETQTKKSRIQRWKNMEDSFEIRNPDKIRGRHILLIDDVITTGASLEACARVLANIPGVNLSIYCLAHTILI